MEQLVDDGMLLIYLLSFIVVIIVIITIVLQLIAVNSPLAIIVITIFIIFTINKPQVNIPHDTIDHACHMWVC